MKNFIFLLCGSLLFISCEKDSTESNIETFEQQAIEEYYIKLNDKEVENLRNRAISSLKSINGPKDFWNIDNDYDPPLAICLPPDIDCGEARSQPSAAQLDVFFDDEDYILNSFNDNYTLATGFFGDVLVDNVIDGTISVRYYQNQNVNNEEFVIFHVNGEPNDNVYAFKL